MKFHWSDIFKRGKDFLEEFFKDPDNVAEIKTCKTMRGLAEIILTKMITGQIIKNYDDNGDLSLFLKILTNSLNNALLQITKDTDKEYFLHNVDKNIFNGFSSFQFVHNTPISRQPVVRNFFLDMIEKIKIVEDFNLEQKATLRIYFESGIHTQIKGIELSAEKFLSANEQAQELITYLREVTTYNQYQFGNDNKSIDEYYVKPILKKMSKATWTQRFHKINEKGVDFEWKTFLESDDWYLIVGASFGMGKSFLSKILASEHASKQFTDEYDEYYIPILYEYTNSFDAHVYNIQKKFDHVLCRIIANDDENKQKKILLLIDLQPDYKGNLDDLIDDLDKIHDNYKNMKVIVFSRLEYRFSQDTRFDDYARLQYFSEDQINEFFDETHYNIGLKYDDLENYGLRHEDVGKPLFCWMIAQLYKQPKKLHVDFQDDWSPEMRKTALYFEFIYGLKFGRPEMTTPLIPNKLEKKILQDISIHKLNKTSKFSKKSFCDILQKQYGFTDTETDVKIEHFLNSYFAIDSDNDELEFIHPSFQDYFLAEYILESVKKGKLQFQTLKMPSSDTIEFLVGWLQLIDCERLETNEYLNNRFSDFKIRTLEGIPEKVEEIQPLLVNKCYELLTIRHFPVSLLGTGEKLDKIQTTEYGVFWIPKWIAMIILIHFGKRPYPAEAASILKHASDMFDPTFKKFKNIDLSDQDLLGVDLGGADLTGANLSRSNMKGSNLSNTILTGTKFEDADLERTNFSDAKIIGTHFNGADLSNSNFDGSSLSCVNFSDSILSHVNFSSASFLKLEEVDKMYRNLDASISDKIINFSAAFILFVNLDGANLNAASFSGALLLNVDLSESQLENADFTEASLVDVSLYKSNLYNSIFINSSIEKTFFNEDGIVIKNANFTGAYASQDSIRTIPYTVLGLDKLRHFPGKKENIMRLIDNLLKIQGVRYAAIFDQSRQRRYGDHVEGVNQTLTHKDKQILFHIVAVSRMIRNKYENEMVNKSICVIAQFEEIKLITIPLEGFVIIITTEKKVDSEVILPMLSGYLESDLPSLVFPEQKFPNPVSNDMSIEIFKSELTKIGSIFSAIIFYRNNIKIKKIIDCIEDTETEFIVGHTIQTQTDMWRRWRLRSRFKKKIGSPQYIVAKYQKYTSVSIQLNEDTLLKVLIKDDAYIKYILDCALALKQNHFSHL